MAKENSDYFIGLTQWHHPNWYPAGIDSKQALSVYAAHFSSIEGNNSFYGLPSETSISQWRTETPAGFRFCFKFPKAISHTHQLAHCDRPLAEFLDRIAPLENKLGILWLQMSHRFAPENVPQLAQFLAQLPKDFTYGIEVRHLDFFKKDDQERRFNQLLMQSGVNRITFDTRALFAHPAQDPITQEALQAKPQMPVHVLATGDCPMVRFITPLDLSLGYAYLAPWVKKVAQWLDEGKTPYLFFHTPDNREAPVLAQYFTEQLAQQRPASPPITVWKNEPPQPELF